MAAAEMDAVAFPDLHITPMLSVSEGSRTLTEVRITGTNTGEIVLGDFGRSFPPTSERQAALEDAVTIIRGAWSEAPFTFAGLHFQTAGARG